MGSSANAITSILSYFTIFSVFALFIFPMTHRCLYDNFNNISKKCLSRKRSDSTTNVDASMFNQPLINSNQIL